MKHKLFNIIASAALALTAQGALAGNIVFSYGDGDRSYGTGGKNAETYDLAILVNNPALVGLNITGVRIAFDSTEGVSDASAWLSTALPTIKSSKAQDPDVTSKAFEAAEEYVTVTFDTPYTITADGIYVGYSFSVEKSTTALYPALVSNNTAPDGLYVHTTKVYRTAWHDLHAQGNLAIEVLLEGDNVKTNAASVVSVSEANIQVGNPSQLSFTVANYGANGIQSLDYRIDVADYSIEKHATLNVPGIFSRTADVEFSLPVIEQKGAYEVNITIEKVNGVANEAEANSGSGLLNAYNTLPIHRAVVEEYTGTWCGYCPRGFVGLEEMQRLYPNDFIGISYHNGDPMEVVSQYPNNVPGFPDAWIDRVRETDAFCGDGVYGTFGIDQTWLERNKVFAPASVDVEAQWTDDSQSVLRATGYVTFPLERDDNPYELGFVLTADGLTGTGSSWSQSNYYSGDTGWPSSMDEFTQGASYVDGLTFNFVLVARSGAAGIEGSLTAPIEADVTQSYSYDFDVDALGSVLVQDKSKLTVVALLINKATGEIANANKVRVGGSTTAVDQLATSADEVVGSTVYYDLQGRRVNLPQNGLFIKSQTLKNGQVRNQKVSFE